MALDFERGFWPSGSEKVASFARVRDAVGPSATRAMQAPAEQPARPIDLSGGAMQPNSNEFLE